MNFNKRNSFLFSWLPGVVLMGSLFYLSHQQGDDLKLPAFFASDKLAHWLAYFVLGQSLFWRFVIRRRLSIKGAEKKFAPMVDWLGIAIGIGYGLSDEIHQSFIPLREVSLLDFLADSIGILSAWFVYIRLPKSWKN